MKTIKTILTFSFLLIAAAAFSAALSWLNPPQFDIGFEGNYRDTQSVISANGQFVAFFSNSSNLVFDDNNSASDVFVRNMQTNEIKIVSTNGAGVQIRVANNISSPSNNGNNIAFASHDENLPLQPAGASIADDFLYIKDLQTGNIHTPLHNGNAIEVVRNSAIIQSPSGQYIYFSTPLNLVANDTNNDDDAYIYDRANTSFELVSIGTDGTAAGGSRLLSVSNNGRYINFSSSTGNVLPLVAGLSDDFGFIRDLDFQTTTIYTVDNSTTPITGSYHYLDNAVVSNNGLVYFCSENDTIVAGDSNGLADFFIYNAGVVSLFPFPNVSEITDFSCNFGKIFVNNNDTKFYFYHYSDQIEPSVSPSSNVKIIFVNLTTQQSTVINQLNGEVYYTQALSASDTLSDISFTAYANPGLVGIESKQLKTIHYNIQNNEFSVVPTAVIPVETPNSSTGTRGLMPDNSNWVLFASQADNIVPYTSIKPTSHLYLLNRSNSEVTRIGFSINSSYDISPNGRYITFSSQYSQDGNAVLLDNYYLYLYDRITQNYSQIVSQIYRSRVNNDGNIVFSSPNSTIVANDTNGESDIFLYVKSTSSIDLISKNTIGGVANDRSNNPEIGGVGTSTWIVFDSDASDLIATDNNNKKDIFLYNWPTGVISRVSELSGVGGIENSFYPEISSDTTTITFTTDAGDLIGETFQTAQLMVYDRILNTLEAVSRDYLGNLPIELDEATYNGTPSSTGRYIAMSTKAKLLANDVPANGDKNEDVYIYDRVTNQMIRMSQYDDSSNYKYDSILNDFVVDDSQTPPLFSVLFTNRNDLNNDYFGLNQAPHDIQQLYLLQSGGEGQQLQVNVTGNGTVTGNLGLNCSSSCSQTYVLGQTVSLLATADAGMTFDHWQGDDCPNSTALTCEVYVNSDKTVEAVFINTTDVIFTNGFEN